MRTMLIAAALASTLAATAIAQDTKTIPTPGSVSTPATAPASGILLTEQEGKAWVDKPIYSSDGVKLGEVVTFQRDSGNKVLGMHADIGGFFGYMQSRVNVQPEQFKLQGDRVILGMTAEQAKSLPKIQS